MRSLLVLLIFLAVSTFQADAHPNQSTVTASVQTTPKSQLVQQYVKAYNGGEATMAAFMRTSSVSDAPFSQRLERYRSMRSDLGDLTLLSMIAESSDGVDVLVQAASGTKLQMTFLMNGDESPKVTGVRILPAGENGSPPGRVTVRPTSSNPENESVVLDHIRQLAQERSKAGTFSGAILIARGSEVIFTNAYGLADRNFQIANQVNTRFDTGSIAKSFTQVAIAQLVEQGKVRLDDTIGKYVPEYPNTPARDKVTIGELLDMTSGVGDIFGERLDQTPVGRIRTLSDYLPLFESEPLAFEPGSKHAYSNGGYILLGIIIEKVTGQSYYDYVHEHIFRPAGMKNTDFPLSDMPHDNEATGYTRMTGDSHAPTSVPGSVKTNVLVMPARGCSAGSARTTVQDLFLYTRALTTETLLKKSTADRLGISGSAMGIGGGGPGVNAGIETGIHSAGPGVHTVIVMSNYDPPAAGDLMRDVSRMLRTAQ